MTAGKYTQGKYPLIISTKYYKFDRKSDLYNNYITIIHMSLYIVIEFYGIVFVNGSSGEKI